MKGTLRQHSFPGYELRDYVAEAIHFLREHEPADGSEKNQCGVGPASGKPMNMQ